MKVRDFFGNVTIIVISISLGVVLSMQFKTIKKADATQLVVERSTTESTLVTQRKDTLQGQIEEKDAEITELKASLLKYQNEFMESDQVLKAELKKMQMLAGLLKVKGQGVIITLDDGTPIDNNSKAENYLIHDSDLLLLVNELKSLGAEAISINDHRIAPSTDIRCAGPTILINSDKVIPPLSILVIGDSEALEKGLTMPGGIYDNFAPFLNMSIEKNDDIIIEAYDKFSVFKHATIVEEEANQ